MAVNFNTPPQRTPAVDGGGHRRWAATAALTKRRSPEGFATVTFDLGGREREGSTHRARVLAAEPGSCSASAQGRCGLTWRVLPSHSRRSRSAFAPLRALTSVSLRT